MCHYHPSFTFWRVCPHPYSSLWRKLFCSVFHTDSRAAQINRYQTTRSSFSETPMGLPLFHPSSFLFHIQKGPYSCISPWKVHLHACFTIWRVHTPPSCTYIKVLFPLFHFGRSILKLLWWSERSIVNPCTIWTVCFYASLGLLRILPYPPHILKDHPHPSLTLWRVHPYPSVTIWMDHPHPSFSV